jgi:hypothetical protein
VKILLAQLDGIYAAVDGARYRLRQRAGRQ